jgi:hypothetical protein
MAADQSSLRQNNRERERISSCIPREFQGEETPAWKAVHARFPGWIGYSEALSLAEALV